MTKTILVTGAIGSGKSTMVEKALSSLDIPVKGFRTEGYHVEGQREGFYIRPATDRKPWPLDKKRRHMIGKIIGYKQIAVRKETFETWGVCYLEEALDGTSLILMDELGIMESRATAFQEAVIRCMDSPQKVVAVIRDEASPFLDRLRARPDARLLRVTEENRNGLMEEMIRWIKAVPKEWEGKDQ